MRNGVVSNGVEMMIKQTKRLSATQKRVIQLLDGGWETEPRSGMSITIHGKRVCNVDTMNALHRLGLVERISVGRWRKALVREC